MLKQKRSKFSRMRGSMTHGGGHKKKRRGSGHRGGFGLSGTGARGDAQKSGIVSNSLGVLKKYSAVHGVKLKNVVKGFSKKSYFGKRGFYSIKNKKVNTISLKYINENFDSMVKSGLIVKEKTEFIFDASLAGYDKVLGNSPINKKLTVICLDISKSAKENIINSGGKVTILNDEDEEE